MVMGRKKLEKEIRKVISIAKRAAKGIDRADKTYRKFTHLRTEIRPASNRYISAATKKIIYHIQYKEI